MTFFFSPFVGGREMRHLESHVLIGCLDTNEDHQLALRAGLRLSLFKFWLAEYWQTRKQVTVILEIACGHHKNTQKYVFPFFFFFLFSLSSLYREVCIHFWRFWDLEKLAELRACRSDSCRENYALQWRDVTVNAGNMLVNHVNTELIHQYILSIETSFQQCDGLIVSRAVCVVWVCWAVGDS